MGQFLIGACVAINGIGFARESKGTAVFATNRKRTTIGEGKNNTRQGLGRKKMAEDRKTGTAK